MHAVPTMSFTKQRAFGAIIVVRLNVC